MYDNQIAEVLRKTYGEDNFKIYCEMQVERSRLANEELQKLEGEPNDYDYETYFWKTKLNEILNQENH